MGGRSSKDRKEVRDENNRLKEKIKGIEEEKDKQRIEEEKAKQRIEEEKAKQPWRVLPQEYSTWNIETVKKLKADIKNVLQKETVGKTIVRILLIGDTGTGKSSLVNSIFSALTGDLIQVAAATAENHTTTQYIEYPLHTWDGQETDENSVPFLICDFRGFGTGEGVSNDAVNAALAGCIRNRSTVGHTSRQQDFDSAENTYKNLLTFVGVVVSATTVNLLGTEDESHKGTLASIKGAMKITHENGVPAFAFLTMCDMLDPVIAEDTTRLYYSEKVKTAVQDLESILLINRSQIIPVKNFSHHVYVPPGMACQFLYPLLSILKQIKASLKIRRDQERAGSRMERLRTNDNQ